MSTPIPCPSCHQPMTKQALTALSGQPLWLDVCLPCRGLWFDRTENLQLTPTGVVDLFKLLHAHRHDDQQALGTRLSCPRCTGALVEGWDVVKSGRYRTHRCGQRHGRFATFAAFMIEKGFVRQLHPAEVTHLAQQLQVIRCNGCGASLDLRRDTVCPYCRSAPALLDPHAVERAMADYARAQVAPAPAAQANDLADALMQVERDRNQALREQAAQSGLGGLNRPIEQADLWAAGLAVVWALLK